MFFIIYLAISNNKNIEIVIDQFKNIPFQANKEVDRINFAANQFEEKLSKSLERIKAKIKTINVEK